MDCVRASRVCSEVFKTEWMASDLVLARDEEVNSEEEDLDLPTDSPCEISMVGVRTHR